MRDRGSRRGARQSINKSTFLQLAYRRETVFRNAASNISAWPIPFGAPSQRISLGAVPASAGPKPWPDIYREPRNERMIVRTFALVVANSRTRFNTGLQSLWRAAGVNDSVS